MNIDTARKIGIIANIACFCTDEQIEKMRALTAIGALSKGQDLNVYHFVNAAKDAESIIADCKKFITLAKRKIKESQKQ